MMSLDTLWAQAHLYAWHEDVVYLVAFVAVIGTLLSRFKPSDRRSVALTLALFFASLAGQFISGVIDHIGFYSLAKWMHETFLILEGITAIRLCGMFAFRLLLPLVRLAPPRILEDIVSCWRRAIFRSVPRSTTWRMNH